MARPWRRLLRDRHVDDPRLPESERLASRYAIGWLNNWAYAGDLPTDDWHGGADSVVRELGLRRSTAGRPRVNPVGALDALEGEAEMLEGERVTDAASNTPARRRCLPPARRGRPDPADPASEVRFRVKEGDGAFATIGVDFASGIAFVARDDEAAAAMPEAYRAGAQPPYRCATES